MSLETRRPKCISALPRLIVRQPAIGIMDRDVMAVDGRKDHQICAAGVAQRRKQDTAEPGRDDQVRELPNGGILFERSGARHSPMGPRVSALEKEALLTRSPLTSQTQR